MNVLVLALLLVPAGTAVAQSRDLPTSALAVEVGGRWRGWWSSREAPEAWNRPHPAIAAALRWHELAPGVALAELRLKGRGEAWRVRVVVAKVDPNRFDFRLRTAVSPDGLLARWNTDSLAVDATIGFNTGHFDGGESWGWVVVDGVELQPPGTGSLAMALVVGAGGEPRLVEPEELASVRAAGGIRTAIQSYPMLLERGGVVPAPLRRVGGGVDLLHRDSRLALGELADGSILIALTRFEGLGGALSELPFGLTVPEASALMGALGCQRAMLLDGGISGQLAIRDGSGGIRRWRGLRRVPLALELVPRSG